MARAVLVYGSEGQFDPIPVAVRIRPIHSTARLSLLGIFSIGTVPFPAETLCPHPLSGGPGRLFTIYEVDQPSPCTWGGGVSMHGS